MYQQLRLHVWFLGYCAPDRQTGEQTDRKSFIQIRGGAPSNKNIKQVTCIKVLNLICEHFVQALICTYGLGYDFRKLYSSQSICGFLIELTFLSQMSTFSRNLNHHWK